jgi:hypothetical protein
MLLVGALRLLMGDGKVVHRNKGDGQKDPCSTKKKPPCVLKSSQESLQKKSVDKITAKPISNLVIELMVYA